jgi:hypothetical protein
VLIVLIPDGCLGSVRFQDEVKRRHVTKPPLDSIRIYVGEVGPVLADELNDIGMNE